MGRPDAAAWPPCPQLDAFRLSSHPRLLVLQHRYAAALRVPIGYADLYGPWTRCRSAKRWGKHGAHPATNGSMIGWSVPAGHGFLKVRVLHWWTGAALAERLQTFAAYYYNRCGEWGIGAGSRTAMPAPPASSIHAASSRASATRAQTIPAGLNGYAEGLKRTPAIIPLHAVSKNGAVILGPRADGTIPAQTLLRQPATGWNQRQGIYGLPRKITAGPTDVPEACSREKKTAHLQFLGGVIYVPSSAAGGRRGPVNRSAFCRAWRRSRLTTKANSSSR